jgi:hypothetical protein
MPRRVAAIPAMVMVVALMGCERARQDSQPDGASRSCGVRAKLQRVSFPAVYNPNSLELNYLVTNDSARDYEMPDTFRALRKSPDNVLHSDANLGVPSDRFFPRGHTVAFSIWINMGNVLNRAPTEGEKAKLERRLVGTRSYVLFDETHGCEIELPVGR